jgi:hypothetical protein
MWTKTKPTTAGFYRFVTKVNPVLGMSAGVLRIDNDGKIYMPHCLAELDPSDFIFWDTPSVLPDATGINEIRREVGEDIIDKDYYCMLVKLSDGTYRVKRNSDDKELGFVSVGNYGEIVVNKENFTGTGSEASMIQKAVKILLGFGD